MEYPHFSIRNLNIQSETIKQRLTLILFKEFWDIRCVPSVQDWKQCVLANCNECENCVQTSSHCNAAIRFTPWLVLSDDVAVFTCAWRSRRWYCDGKAWCRGNALRSEEFDACYPDWRRRTSTGCSAPEDTDYKALDGKEVVGIKTCQCKTTHPDTHGECTPLWSRVDWERASKSGDPGAGVYFTGCFRSMDGS